MQPLLFRPHTPHVAIAGGGFFAIFSLLPMSLTWGTFGIENGAQAPHAMRERIEMERVWWW